MLDRLDPTGRFSNRADDYAKHRPSYPDAAIDAILQGLTAPPDLVAADVGAGTGISARALASRGVRVLALEPNSEMRRAAPPDPRVEWLDATGEKTGLADASVDLVLCAQSFHWLDFGLAYEEFHRILRLAGRLALIWNYTDDTDPYSAAYRALVRAAALEELDAIGRIMSDFRIDSPRFVGARISSFRHEQPLDVEGLLGRAASASYVPKSGPRHDALVGGLRSLHARFADSRGLCRLLYETRVHLADPVPY